MRGYSSGGKEKLNSYYLFPEKNPGKYDEKVTKMYSKLDFFNYSKENHKTNSINQSNLIIVFIKVFKQQVKWNTSV